MAKKRSERGRIFLRGKSQRWYCQYYVDRKQIIARLLNADNKPCTSREQAEDARARLLSPLLAHDKADAVRQVFHALQDAETTAAAIVEENRPRLAIADAWGRFEAAPNRPQCGTGTLRDYRQRWGKFAEWMQENAKTANMETVSRDHVAGFVKSLSGLSSNRFNKIVGTCRLVYRVLADDCGNVNNPFTKVVKQKLVMHGHREFTEKELADVCGTADGELRLLLALGLYTALRLKDCALLRWESVKMDTRRIVIVPAKTMTSTGKTLVIPLHATLAAMLAETPEKARRGYVLPNTAAKYQKYPSIVVNGIREHLKACGIETQERHPGHHNATCAVGFHSLRHSFVSLCARAGVPLAIVQELAGHSSPAIQRHYMHMGEAATRQAIDALPKLTDSLKTRPIDVKALPAAPADEAEAKDRGRFRDLSGTLPIKTIRRFLKSVEAK